MSAVIDLPPESEAQSIVRRMTELGYYPSPGLEADRVVFYKDFSDLEGRRARVYVYFDKPIMGMAGLRLSSVSISTQIAVHATEEAIAREAPEPLRDDLLGVLHAFPEYTGALPDQSVVTRACIRCKRSSARFYVINSDAVCTACVEERKSKA